MIVVETIILDKMDFSKVRKSKVELENPRSWEKTQRVVTLLLSRRQCMVGVLIKAGSAMFTGGAEILIYWRIINV